MSDAHGHNVSSRHDSQVVYGVGTSKSYKGQRTARSHRVTIILVAILVALLLAALVLGAAIAI